jgi:hypothetical protein
MAIPGSSRDQALRYICFAGCRCDPYRSRPALSLRCKSIPALTKASFRYASVLLNPLHSCILDC